MEDQPPPLKVLPQRVMPKGGRPKGSQNRTTIQIKTALLKALDRLGGVDYLVKVGEENPAVFCALLAKIIPTELKATVNELPVVRVFSGAPQAQVIEAEGAPPESEENS